MSKIVTVAFLFAKAMLKEKSTYLFVVFAALALVIAVGLGGIDIGSEYKLFEDVLLTSQGYLFVVGAIFYAFWLLGRDRTVGLFVLPLASGMKRQEYLGALMLTQVFMIGLLFLLFIVLDFIVIYGVEGELYIPLFGQLFLYYLSAVLTAFLAMALSQYVSLTNSMLYALLLFWVGNALDELYIFTHSQGSGEFVAAVLYYLLPNFSFFDQQGVVVNREDFEWGSRVILPLIYSLLWSGVLFLAAWHRFRNKALTVGR